MNTLQNLLKVLNQREKILNQAGMTLIEIMVVITILGLIAGAVSVAVFNQLHEAKVKTTETQIKDIESALELFRLSNNRFPTTAEGLNGLVNPPKGQQLMKKVPKDPWDNEYVFICPGQHNQKSFDLYSYGADGVEGGSEKGKDVTNWE